MSDILKHFRYEEAAESWMTEPPSFFDVRNVRPGLFLFVSVATFGELDHQDDDGDNRQGNAGNEEPEHYGYFMSACLSVICA